MHLPMAAALAITMIREKMAGVGMGITIIMPGIKKRGTGHIRITGNMARTRDTRTITPTWWRISDGGSGLRWY